MRGGAFITSSNSGAEKSPHGRNLEAEGERLLMKPAQPAGEPVGAPPHPALGTAPEVRVGVCRRSGSVMMAVGLLAILKAGGAYCSAGPGVSGGTACVSC